MYTERLRAIQKVYANAERDNKAYKEAQDSIAEYKYQASYVFGLEQGLQALNALIANQEKEWRESVLRTLEADIMEALTFVYPNDGYTVSLKLRVLRNKLHVDSEVSSYFTGAMPGDISYSQGRLFQQIVSAAALAAVMRLLHIDTVYMDEAFSGASRRNIEKVNSFLKHLQSKGLNLILIAQDTSMADGIDSNVLLLSRSIDNKTTIVQNRK